MLQMLLIEEDKCYLFRQIYNKYIKKFVAISNAKEILPCF